MNYFELFEIPEHLLFDAEKLQEKFYELSRKYHPDFYSQSSEQEQQEVLEKSSQINKAFQIFKNLDLTIAYVLKENNFLEDDEKYSLPNNFLMEMMEFNESLVDAQMDDDLEKVKLVKQEIKVVNDNLWNSIKSIIQDYSGENKTTEKLQTLKDYYFKKKYLNRILEGLE